MKVLRDRNAQLHWAWLLDATWTRSYSLLVRDSCTTLSLIFLSCFWLEFCSAEERHRLHTLDRAFLEVRQKYQQYSDAGLYIYSPRGVEPIYSFETGKFSRANRILIASATKWVSAALIMRVVEEGKLKLSTPLNQFFELPSTQLSNITLHQLLAFQSGLTSSSRNPCRATKDLQTCAEKILKENEREPLEKGFRYSNVHLFVAGALVERATNDTWNNLFRKHVTVPLGLTSDPFFTDAVHETPARTPMIAGGLFISTDDYATFLRTIFNQGKNNDREWLKRNSVATLLTSSFTQSTLTLFSPFSRLGRQSYSYGYGNWVECEHDLFCKAPRNSSPGYYGFYPWMDRYKGYYAILATKAAWVDFRASKKAAKIVDTLRPEIENLVEEMSSATNTKE